MTVPGFINAEGELTGSQTIFTLSADQFLAARDRASTGGINWLSGTTQSEYSWATVVRRFVSI